VSGAPSHLLRRVADYLVGQQQPAGGWSYTQSATQTDVDDTAVAVEALHRVDPARYRDAIRRGHRSLLLVRGTDGGFPTYVHGAPSEASMTAAALDGLSTSPHQHTDQLTTGLRYLAAEQRPDGTFPPDWSSSQLHTLFRAVLAADRLPAPRPAFVERMVDSAFRLLELRRNDDGGWGQVQGGPSDPISTSYALITLCGSKTPDLAIEAAGYLIRHQQPDGGFQSPSDSIGPRPFIFSVPVLADIFALLAFGHLHSRLSSSARQNLVTA
jgi:hypothetical protein